MLPHDARAPVRCTLSVLVRGVISQQLCRKANADGRVGAVEILLQNYAVSHMIRDNKVHQLEGYLQTASNDGTGAQSLDHSLFTLVRDGLVEGPEAVSMATFPAQLKKRIEELPAER